LFLFIYFGLFGLFICTYSSEISPGSKGCFFTGLGGEQSGVLGLKCAGFSFLGDDSSSESNVILTTFFSTAAPVGRR
jgi:hypothetical protein